MLGPPNYLALGDCVCHHDSVGHIKTEVVTHENLQTTVRIIYKDVMMTMSIETELQNITVLVEIMLALSASTAFV